tara:strand:- start:708 stop:1235 length:528 start_codon:yes stop_codon:yes gene_type:complete
MANPMYGQNKADNVIDTVKGLVYHDVAANTHTDTTTAADISSYGILTADLKVGSCIKVKSLVKVTDNNSTDTATVIAQLGGVSGTTSGAIDVADNDLFYFDIQIVITKMGSAGTAECFGYVGTDATASTLLHADNVSMTSIDFSGSTVNLGINCDWSVAHAENILTHQWTTIEIV